MAEAFPIHSYLNNLDLLKQTAEQIIKDFSLFGLEIKFGNSGYDAYEELFSQVQPHIERLMSRDYQRLMSILYRIDIGEQQLKKKLQENSSDSTSGVISELIIKRELQKVVIRNYYKKNER